MSDATRAPEEPAVPDRRHVRRQAASLGAVHLVLALLLFDPSPYIGGDNAVYVSLALSLVEEGRYLSYFDPATPPHAQFPPGFPAALALLMLLGVRDWIGWKLLVVGCSVAAVVLSFLWMRTRLPARAAWWTGLVLAVSPGVLYWSHWVLSDVPFWAVAMLALWAFEDSAGERPGRSALAVGATVAAYFLRAAALPLVLASAAWLLLRRRWSTLGWLLGALAVLGGLWWLRGETLATGDGYGSHFLLRDPYDPGLGRAELPEIAMRVGDNVRSYTITRLPVLLFGGASLATFAAAFVLTSFAIFGWVRAVRSPRVADLFFPLYLGLFLVWPQVWADDRFLLPILPLLLVYAAVALLRVSARGRPGPRAAARLAAPLLLIALGLPTLARGIPQSLGCLQREATGQRDACLPGPWRDFFSLAREAREALPPGSAVLSRKPELFFLLSGHRGRNYPMAVSGDSLLKHAAAAGARFVVLDRVSPLAARYLVPSLAERPGAFCARRDLSRRSAYLLEIRPEGAAPPPLARSGAGDAGLALRACPTAPEPAADAPGRDP